MFAEHGGQQTMRQPVQTAYAFERNHIFELKLPPADSEVLRGVPWGSFDEVGTAAYWRVQAWHHDRLGTYRDLRLGRELAEELTACLLGGYGMPADLALAAYWRLRSMGLIRQGVKQEVLEEALGEPFNIRGRERRYRFPKQKACYLSRCLARLDGFAPEDRSDITLRESLADFPGIGPKTASWIVRNYRDSDAVAILDVHIIRAGRMIGIFGDYADPQCYYYDLEQRFLALAKALNVRASLLDAMIWDQMRRMSHALPHPAAPPRVPSKVRPADQGHSTRSEVRISA
jgi:thermostable 8-oxoguanine DNA glycosylase